MSRSHYVRFRDDGFWVYDVPSSVFLKFLIDAACVRLTFGGDEWLNEAIQHWRVSAAIPEMSRYANDEWTAQQIETVIKLTRGAIEAITFHGDFLAAEVESWTILDDVAICTRGHDPIAWEPIARIGNAFISLLQNAMPKPPKNHRWFYTLDETVDTIAMRLEA